MKLLGLDVGEKRIGVASVDSQIKLAVPLETILVDGQELERIKQLARIHQTQTIIVGLPRNADGLETAQTEVVRRFATRLNKIGLKTYFQDESLTSVLAEERLEQLKKPYAKADIDKEAATLILQDFVDSLAQNSTSPSKQPDLSRQASINQQDTAPKKHKKGSIKKSLFISIGAVTILAAALVGLYFNAARPFDASCTHCQKRFVIAPGESTSTILAHLGQADLIRSPLFSHLSLLLDKNNSTLKSGAYVLSQTMTPKEIFSILSGATTTEDTTLKLTFPARSTIADTRNLLKQVGYSESEITEALDKVYDFAILEGLPEGATLEGYLHPGDYIFSPAASAEDIISARLSASQKIIRDNSLEDRFESFGYTLHQGIALAALIEENIDLSNTEKYIPADDLAKTQVYLDGAENTPSAPAFSPSSYALLAVGYHDSLLPYIFAGSYDNWVAEYGEIAMSIQKHAKYGGIPYEAILAQSILESSWGKSKLAYKYFNFFGIKYANMPTNTEVAPSGSVNMETWEEYTPGQTTPTTANFATWSSTYKGFLGYGAWIHNQPRYKTALKYPGDPVQYITELKKAGYATDSNYIAILTSLIQEIQKTIAENHPTWPTSAEIAK